MKNNKMNGYYVGIITSLIGTALISGCTSKQFYGNAPGDSGVSSSQSASSASPVPGSYLYNSQTITPGSDYTRPVTDVVFIVDNSNSMADNQARMADAVMNMIPKLKDKEGKYFNVNFRIHSTGLTGANKAIALREIFSWKDANGNTQNANAIPAVSSTISDLQYLAYNELTAPLNNGSNLQLKQTDGAAEILTLQNNLKAAITNVGVNGDRDEKGLDTLAFLLSDTTGQYAFTNLTKKVAFIFLTDATSVTYLPTEVDKHSKRSFTTSYSYNPKTSTSSITTTDSTDTTINKIRYTTNVHQVSLKYTTKSNVQELNNIEQVINYNPLNQGYTSNACPTTADEDCNLTLLNTVKNSLSTDPNYFNNYNFTSCKRSCVSKNFDITDSLSTERPLDRCLTSAGTNYLANYILNQSTVRYMASNTTCTKTYYKPGATTTTYEWKSISSEKFLNLGGKVSATTSFDFKTAIKNKLIEQYPNGGYILSFIINQGADKETPECMSSSESVGQAYIDLANLINSGLPDNKKVAKTYSICADGPNSTGDYSPALLDVNNFISENAKKSFPISVPAGYSVYKVSDIAPDGTAVVLTSTQYSITNNIVTLINEPILGHKFKVESRKLVQ